MAKSSLEKRFSSWGWMAISSLITGIAAAALSFLWFANSAAIPMAIISIVFGTIAIIIRYDRSKAVAGIAISVIALIFTIVFQVQNNKEINGIRSDVQELQESVKKYYDKMGDLMDEVTDYSYDDEEDYDSHRN